jgi:ribonuclease HI
MSTDPVLYIHTDGASRGNPGRAAYAYVIESPDGEAIEEGGDLGTMTNNRAEYTALVRALEHALELGSHHRVVVQSDSELLVKQMNGEYRVKSEDLRDLFARAQELRGRFDGGVTIRHVRREQNSRADALCNEVLDGKRLSSAREVVAAVAARERAATKPSHEQEARRVLEAAAEAWKQGRNEPSVDEVWRDLAAIFQKHHLRPGGRAKRHGQAPA